MRIEQADATASAETMSRANARRWRIALAACLCVILGAKLWLIATAGSVVPYWDQWDAEAAFLYDPYLAGTLGPDLLLAAHNEHRVLFTRLLSIIELEALGSWDPVVQMIVNAGLHVAAIALFLLCMRRFLSPSAVMALVVMTAFVFAIPFGIENTLAGFQSQFYLLIAAAVASLYLVATSPIWSGRWWAGALIAASSFFCMASGALTLVAAAAVMILQAILGRRDAKATAVAVLLLLAVAGVEIWATPDLARHAMYKAKGIGDFLGALRSTAAWPGPPFTVGALFFHAPVLLLTVFVLRSRPQADDRIWFCLAMAAWVGLQFASVAYGRATMPRAPRYLDIHSMGLLVNFAALAYLLQRWSPNGRRPLLIGGAWAAVACLAMLRSASIDLPPALATKMYESERQQEHVTRFLATGDRAALRGKPHLHVPYYDIERLGDLLERPNVRGVLSLELVGNTAASAAARSKLVLGGGWPWLGSALRSAAAVLGYALPLLGALLFMFLAVAGIVPRVRNMRARPIAG